MWGTFDQDETDAPQEHGNNRMVGWLEGLEGLCSLFFAIPFGTLADRWRRDRVLRISSCIELGAHNLASDNHLNVSLLQPCASNHPKPSNRPTSVQPCPSPAMRLHRLCGLCGL